MPAQKPLTAPQALQQAKAAAPSATPAQQHQLATQIQQQSRQPSSGSGVRTTQRKTGSFSTPMLIGLGVAGVLGIGLIVYAMRDD